MKGMNWFWLWFTWMVCGAVFFLPFFRSSADDPDPAPSFTATTVLPSESITFGEALRPVTSVSASGEVTILDWHVEPRPLALRFAFELLWSPCSGINVDLVWRLWDAFIDESGRSARCWREP